MKVVDCLLQLLACDRRSKLPARAKQEWTRKCLLFGDAIAEFDEVR